MKLKRSVKFIIPAVVVVLIVVAGGCSFPPREKKKKHGRCARADSGKFKKRGGILWV